MERSPRLRTLPSRLSSDRNKSAERTTKKSKSPSRARNKNKPTPRKSRSRSSGRKKIPSTRYSGEGFQGFEAATTSNSDFSTPNLSSPTQSKSDSSLKLAVETIKSIVERRPRSKDQSRSVSKVKEETSTTSKVKEGSRASSKLKELGEFLTEKIEKVRESVSPQKDIRSRRSLSHFLEARNAEVRSSVQKMSSPGVSTGSENSIAAVKTDQEIKYREKGSVTEDRLGETKAERKTQATWVEHIVNKYSLAQIFLYLFFGVLMSLALLVLRVICRKDDCQLLSPELEIILDFNQYFDSYVWPIYTLSVALLYAASGFCDARLKGTYISYTGVVSMVLLCSAGFACHKYYDGLRHTNPLHLLAATIFHIFLINMLAANFTKLFVNLDSFVTKLSSLLTLLLVGNIAAIESSSDSANMNLYIALIPPGLLAFNSLTMKSLPTKAGPLFLLYTALSPFFFTLPHVFISVNKIELNTWVVSGATALSILGWVFLTYCQLTKLKYLLNPNMQNDRRMWKIVHYPDISWRVICEISIAVATYASPISYVIPVVSILAAVLNAYQFDKYANPLYANGAKYSLFPYIY